MAFLVNEAVTTADLNNIAVDLGDAEFSAFSAQKFGVDKLNAITADLVTSGVLRSGDMCKPILSGGAVSIQTGVIVFADGAKLRVTAVQNITAVAGNYIAARYDSANGTCKLVSVESIPDEPGVQYMVLAKVSADGTAITDLRTMAKSKSASYEQSTENVFFEIAVNEITHTSGATTGTITLSDSPEIPENFNFKKICYLAVGRGLYEMNAIPDSDWLTLDLGNMYDSNISMRRTATGFEFKADYASTFNYKNRITFI